MSGPGKSYIPVCQKPPVSGTADAGPVSAVARTDQRVRGTLINTKKVGTAICSVSAGVRLGLPDAPREHIALAGVRTGLTPADPARSRPSPTAPT